MFADVGGDVTAFNVVSDVWLTIGPDAGTWR